MRAPVFGYLTPETLGLFTDRYELTMLQGYRHADHTPEATFSLFFRRLPPNRGYAIAAGLEQAIAYLQSVSFDERASGHLRAAGFPENFVADLTDFSFTGDVRAIPEGRRSSPTNRSSRSPRRSTRPSCSRRS